MTVTKKKSPAPAAPPDAEFVGSPPGELVRLQKVLAAAGIGSRRHCEEYIRAGRVAVDGRTVRELGIKVDPQRQKIQLDGEVVEVERKVYYLVNKPTGFVSTNQDPHGRRRVIDLLPHARERLFTVGRLDEESQGLMIVTNDGELAHRLAHPRYGVPKTYRVQVAGNPTRDALQLMRTGIEFTEGVFKVESVRQVRKLGKSSLLEIVLTEGQNREIRRLLARLGHKVMRLERTALGPIKMIRLPLGRFRPLTSYEVQQLQALVAGPPRRKSARRPANRGDQT
jgi:23S rRNA pseudouridine2605 synthase